MINNAISPFMFNISVIKPIVKNAYKDADDLQNLRPVAISDALSNLYESVVLNEINKHHKEHVKQLGFKKNSSCAHAIYAIKETVSINTKRNRRTYVCFIDASKAFDKVNRCKLWIKMLKSDIPVYLTLSLIEYYNSSLMLVQNDESVSDIFATKVGVKQGGVISPKLFNIYVEDLIKRVESMNCGILIGKILMDILLYADDITIVSDTKLGLKLILDEISLYGLDNDIKFNPSKTVLMIFNDKVKRTRDERLRDIWQGEILMSGIPLRRDETNKYLGVQISQTKSNTPQLNYMKKQAYAALAKVTSLGLSSVYMNPVTKAFIYKTYIRPVLMYGSENFTWTKTDLNAIRRIEGNLVKRMLNISTRCHTTDLFESLNLEQTLDFIANGKNAHYVRIMSNTLTKEILCESYKLDAGLGSKGEILRDFSESVIDSIEDVIDGIQMKITLDTILSKQFKKCASNSRRV